MKEAAESEEPVKGGAHIPKDFKVVISICHKYDIDKHSKLKH